MSDIELAFNTIIGKQRGYTELFSYADGNQPLKYSTERLREAICSVSVLLGSAKETNSLGETQSPRAISNPPAYGPPDDDGVSLPSPALC